MLKELSLGTTIISLDYNVERLEPFQVIEVLYGSECCRIYIHTVVLRLIRTYIGARYVHKY